MWRSSWCEEPPENISQWYPTWWISFSMNKREFLVREKNGSDRTTKNWDVMAKQCNLYHVFNAQNWHSLVHPRIIPKRSKKKGKIEICTVNHAFFKHQNPNLPAIPPIRTGAFSREAIFSQISVPVCEVMELKSYLEDLEVPKPNREVNMTWDPFTTMTNLEDVILCSYEKKYNTIPIGSMVLLYMVTFTINIPPMLAYIYIYHTWILWDSTKIWDSPWPYVPFGSRPASAVKGAPAWPLGDGLHSKWGYNL